MQIPLDHFQGSVTEDRLQCIDVTAIFEVLRCKCMSEQMRVQAGDAATLFQLAKDVLHCVSRERFTVYSGEYIRREDVLGSDKFEISAEQSCRGFANRDCALLLAFAVDDAISVFKVEQGIFKSKDFEQA